MRLLLALLLLPCLLHAQTVDDGIVESAAGTQALNTDTEEENLSAVENFSETMAHQTDLNSAGPEQLRLLGLDATQVQNLINHRSINGNLLSIYELQSIDGYDTTLIRRLKQVATVKDPAQTLDEHFLRRIQSDGYSYLLVKTDLLLEQRRGFSSSTSEEMQFYGNRPGYTLRFRSFRAGDFSFGITAENDPGEKFRWRPSSSQYGFDYLAIHAQVQNKGWIRNLIVGNYQAQFGQGLVWGGAIGFGKGAEAITNTRRANIGLVPYTSAYESGYLHGAALSASVAKHFLLSALVSSVKRDASLGYRSEGQVITSLQTSGLHRNSGELEKRKVAAQNVAGLVLEYDGAPILAGVSYQFMDLGLPVSPPRYLYNQFAFRSNQNQIINAYVNYTYHNVSFFSEVARTVHGGEALVAGALIGLTPKLDLSLLYRNYAKNYIAPFSNAFSENTLPVNEKGMYWGWKYKLNKRYYFSGYLDYFTFPWLKFRTYAPSRGNEWLIHFHWQPARTTTLFLQMRQENKLRNSSDAVSLLYKLNRLQKTSYWFHAEHYISPAIRMKTRIQWSTFSNGGSISEGFALAQDVAVTKGKAKITARYALFQTDDYDNRQYMYENDVWLAYSLPAYYGQGVRKYLLLQYKVNKTLTWWIKYSHTRYLNRETIGSGMDLINGNQQNDIKFEVRIHL